tara:strand:- start:145 stop:1110 length:966 start_codon:yes stop_codon:yes gene_type:complete
MINSIFNINNNNDFKKIALDIFKYQAKNNKVYKNYLQHLDINSDKVRKINDIIYLPIILFKSHEVKIQNEYDVIFRSSGTTNKKKSNNYIYQLSLYNETIIKNFEYFFGDIKQYTFIGVCPEYKHNKQSSLLYMINQFIKKSQNQLSSFCNNNFEIIDNLILQSYKIKKTPILFGISSLLMELAEKNNKNYQNCIIVETGGSKGLKQEITKDEMYKFLKQKLKPKYIYSEYSMTELMSQAYALKQNQFQTPPWMKIKIRNINNPFDILKDNKTGGLNIIDLANYNTCSFIQTDDIGRQNNNIFEIFGRYDNSMARGCSMLN